MDMTDSICVHISLVVLRQTQSVMTLDSFTVSTHLQICKLLEKVKDWLTVPRTSFSLTIHYQYRSCPSFKCSSHSNTLWYWYCNAFFLFLYIINCYFDNTVTLRSFFPSHNISLLVTHPHLSHQKNVGKVHTELCVISLLFPCATLLLTSPPPSITFQGDYPFSNKKMNITVYDIYCIIIFVLSC